MLIFLEYFVNEKKKNVLVKIILVNIIMKLVIYDSKVFSIIEWECSYFVIGGMCNSCFYFYSLFIYL